MARSGRFTPFNADRPRGGAAYGETGSRGRNSAAGRHERVSARDATTSRLEDEAEAVYVGFAANCSEPIANAEPKPNFFVLCQLAAVCDWPAERVQIDAARIADVSPETIRLWARLRKLEAIVFSKPTAPTAAATAVLAASREAECPELAEERVNAAATLEHVNARLETLERRRPPRSRGGRSSRQPANCAAYRILPRSTSLGAVDPTKANFSWAIASTATR